MENYLTIAIIYIAFLPANAQNTVWLKNERQNIMDDGIYLLSKYDFISKDKKELIAKCYMDFITTTYSNVQYQNLIEYELKTIQKSTLEKCSKDIGFDLNQPPKLEVKTEPVKEPTKKNNSDDIANKENLIGHWADENSDFWLYESGDYKMTFNDGKVAKGTWKIDNNELYLYKDQFIGNSLKFFKILLFTKDKFVYQSVKKKSDTYTATRIK